ncbi:MAG: helix-turn-helix domain-containing protein [Phycisphaerales bacterium]|nr:helix-turn-helix domain-containing protein [Phycisphaerales bacterium]
MANRLKMAKVHSIQTLHAAGWSQRRIARVLGVDRGTVARYVQAARAVEQNQPNLPTGPPDDQDQPNPPTGSGGASGGQNQPNPPAGSGPASRCAAARSDRAWLERGLSAQRIWQDLKAEHAFSGGYDSVKRFA